MTMRRRAQLTARLLERPRPLEGARLPGPSRTLSSTLRAWGVGALVAAVLVGMLATVDVPALAGQPMAALEQAWWLGFGAAIAAHLLVLGTVGIGMLRRR